jgi:hypothetical protein
MTVETPFPTSKSTQLMLDTVGLKLFVKGYRDGGSELIQRNWWWNVL